MRRLQNPGGCFIHQVDQQDEAVEKKPGRARSIVGNHPCSPWGKQDKHETRQQGYRRLSQAGCFDQRSRLWLFIIRQGRAKVFHNHLAHAEGQQAIDVRGKGCNDDNHAQIGHTDQADDYDPLQKAQAGGKNIAAEQITAVPNHPPQQVIFLPDRRELLEYGHSSALLRAQDRPITKPSALLMR